MFKLSDRSRGNLHLVFPDLVTCVILCMKHFTPIDFVVIEGKRLKKRQRKLVKQGRSWTMDSKHLVQDDGWVHAVDLVPLVDGQVPWGKPPVFEELAKAMKATALFQRIEITWGGDWSDRQKDSPHYQIKL